MDTNLFEYKYVDLDILIYILVKRVFDRDLNLDPCLVTNEDPDPKFENIPVFLDAIKAFYCRYQPWFRAYPDVNKYKTVQ